jgi:lipoyl(octanoyl) transferase
VTLLANPVAVRKLGRVGYTAAFEAMRAFTAARTPATPDELWLLEHPPVYTLGQGAEALAPRNGIPLIRSDRGGEITYHGPGQLLLYALVDLARRELKVKRYVWILEQCVIDVLGARAARRPGAPGVYVDGAKVAALGIRVARGRAYHGLALNVDMDLAPFAAIAPCGFPGLPVTRTVDLAIAQSMDVLGDALAARLLRRLEDA